MRRRKPVGFGLERLAVILLAFVVLVASGLFYVLAEQAPSLPVIHPQQTRQTVTEMLVVFFLYATALAGLFTIYSAPRTGRRTALLHVLVGATLLALSAILLHWLPSLKPYP
jgi:uncharacterized BrkB/YihY/UPF0761 family membrane protein